MMVCVCRIACTAGGVPVTFVGTLKGAGVNDRRELDAALNWTLDSLLTTERDRFQPLAINFEWIPIATLWTFLESMPNSEWVGEVDAQQLYTVKGGR